VGGSVEDVACGDVLAGDEHALLDDQCDCGGQRESDRDSPQHACEVGHRVSTGAARFEHVQRARVDQIGAGLLVRADLASCQSSAHVGWFVDRAPTPAPWGSVLSVMQTARSRSERTGQEPSSPLSSPSAAPPISGSALSMFASSTVGAESAWELAVTGSGFRAPRPQFHGGDSVPHKPALPLDASRRRNPEPSSCNIPAPPFRQTPDRGSTVDDDCQTAGGAGGLPARCDGDPELIPSPAQVNACTGGAALWNRALTRAPAAAVGQTVAWSARRGS